MKDGSPLCEGHVHVKEAMAAKQQQNNKRGGGGEHKNFSSTYAPVIAVRLGSPALVFVQKKLQEFPMGKNSQLEQWTTDRWVKLHKYKLEDYE